MRRMVLCATVLLIAVALSSCQTMRNVVVALDAANRQQQAQAAGQSAEAKKTITVRLARQSVYESNKPTICIYEEFGGRTHTREQDSTFCPRSIEVAR